ncbi:MAG TPA: DUF1579 domain-containing protein [Caulobacteraceae bacterium]
MKTACIATIAATLICAGPAAARTEPQLPAAAAATTVREAMARLSFMHGVWVGPASGVNPDRTAYAVTQTERIGPMLGGDVLVIEGRGYLPDGSTGFNAFAVVSYDARAGRYEIRSYTGGMAGTFPLTLTEDGYVWEVRSGPGVMRFTATVNGDRYEEVGDFVMEGRPPVRSFQMSLARRGDTDWPAAGAVQR